MRHPQITHLVRSVKTLTNFLVEQCEFGNDYCLGIVHSIGYLVSVTLSNLYGKQSVSIDETIECLNLRHDGSQTVLSETEIRQRIESVINSDFFKKLT